MHYANGQEAKQDDLVFRAGKYCGGTEVIGKLVSATAGSTSCNGRMVPIATRSSSDLGSGNWQPAMYSGEPWYVTLGELMPLAMPAYPDAAPPQS